MDPQLPQFQIHIISRFSSSMDASAPAYFDDSALPAYTTSRSARRNTLAARAEHVFASSTGSLRMTSAASSSSKLPVFNQGEDITGTVTVESDKFDSVQSIIVQVTGRLITGARTEDTLVFLDRTEVLYKRASPRGSPSPRSDSPLDQGHRFDFALRLPNKVALSSKTGVAAGAYSLPQSYVDTHESATIRYALSVVFERGRFKSNTSLQTPFTYMPASKPDPMSSLRQLSYEDGSHLFGPEMDPTGWSTSTSICARSTCDMRAVDVNCTLSLANPLSYTRGTVIPCAMTLNADSRALDALTAPRAIIVRLQRRIDYQGRDGANTVEDVAEAVWWPSRDEWQQDRRSRQLQGEIRLPKNMMPSTDIGSFSISYSVALLPFEAASRFASAESQPLLTVQVEITTKHARGPRPRVYSPPPSYNSSS